MKVLIADDEKALLTFLEKGLSAEGIECTTVNDLHDLIGEIAFFKPDVIVLDRMFGFEDSVLKLADIKQLGNPMVILLTALDDTDDKIEGLTLGADDYLCKPFDFDELIARINALYRRKDANLNASLNQISVGSLTLLTGERLVLVEEKEITASKIEFDLLLYLAKNQNKVMNRERILSRVWQLNSDPQTNVVDVYISKIRKKISHSDVTIQTLRGNGYRLSLN
ncbi:MAG: response regulator transcription factor [Pseudomonadota bacterium]